MLPKLLMRSMIPMTNRSALNWWYCRKSLFTFRMPFYGSLWEFSFIQEHTKDLPLFWGYQHRQPRYQSCSFNGRLGRCILSALHSEPICEEVILWNFTIKVGERNSFITECYWRFSSHTICLGRHWRFQCQKTRKKSQQTRMKARETSFVIQPEVHPR